MDSLQDAEERAEKARELQTRLGLDVAESIVVADSPAAELYRQLKAEELLVEVGSLEAQIIQATKTGRQRRDRFWSFVATLTLCTRSIQSRNKPSSYNRPISF